MSESKTITVRSRSDAFRRAGIAFTRAGVTLDLAELSKEQIAAIQAEPALVIERGDVEAELAAGAAGKKAKAK